VTVSPDGRNVYVASYASSAVAVFDRGPTGILTQKPGSAGCVSEAQTGGVCAPGRALTGAHEVTVSPDGSSVYVASATSNAVAVFDRSADGALTQKPGKAGCVSEIPGSPRAPGTALDGAVSVTVSPNGASVYVASLRSNAVAVFDRGRNGTLRQKLGMAGCVADITTNSGACSDALALGGASSVRVSPDDRNVYVASLGSDAVVAFTRSADGTLTQGWRVTDPVSCISQGGAHGCRAGIALDAARGLVVSPDGSNVYVASAYSSAVAVFDRSPKGVLTQKPDLAACVSEDGNGPCADGLGLQYAQAVAVSPDGRSAYVTADPGAVAVFDRTGSAGPPIHP